MNNKDSIMWLVVALLFVVGSMGFGTGWFIGGQLTPPIDTSLCPVVRCPLDSSVSSKACTEFTTPSVEGVTSTPMELINTSCSMKCDPLLEAQCQGTDTVPTKSVPLASSSSKSFRRVPVSCSPLSTYSCLNGTGGWRLKYIERSCANGIFTWNCINGTWRD